MTIAHVREDGETQSVKKHLENTADLSEKYAGSFCAGDIGRFTGMIHDIGKYSDDFQKRIRGEDISVDHSTAGAQVALKMGNPFAAFCIAGHHGGIPNGGNRFDTADDPTMIGRSKKTVLDFSAWKKEIRVPPFDIPDFVLHGDPFTQSFFTRMLYSCLVDADYLDTERFMTGDRSGRGGYDALPVLLQRLQKKTDTWLADPDPDRLKIARNDVLSMCIEKGRSLQKGLYTLTVTTGGGKTVSSLSFALEQAVSCSMERVIYVAPYMTIIDQTASVFQGILGDENVLAHYSEADLKDPKMALAAENWDAPVIVTTAVQFFESLYSNKSSKCRKLHNLANSVIILDEAQTLPIPYLSPCVVAIAQLVEHYRSSVILCTATQPYLVPLFKSHGIAGREIMTKKIALPKRASIQDIGCVSKKALAEQLSLRDQVLCVVNTRKRAQELYGMVKGEGTYCLTTLLTPHDRKEKISEIRSRLAEGKPCRVISTSLIEAGVDVDFPVVYREETGLDSLIQSAGRSNREGKLERGFVYLYSLEGISPPPAMRQQVAAMRAVQRSGLELDSEEAVKEYFDILLYRIKDGSDLDRYGILDAFSGTQFPFADVAKKFRLIDNDMCTIYIPRGEGSYFCREIEEKRVTGDLIREAGKYSVSVYKNEFHDLRISGAISLIDEKNAVLADKEKYDPETGLKVNLSYPAKSE